MEQHSLKSGCFLFGKDDISMAIKNITTNDLRKMNDKEGIILQGCGGDPQGWIDGVNEMFKEGGILLDDTKFTDAYVFDNDNLTCMLFPFDNNVHLNTSKLAMWRLQSYTAFAGMWLSDYVDNRLGGFEPEQNKAEKFKPDCALIGCDGNVFALLGMASRTLKQNGMADEAEMMCTRIRGAKNYCEALNIIGEYVNITDGSEQSDDIDEDFNEGQAMKL